MTVVVNPGEMSEGWPSELGKCWHEMGLLSFGFLLCDVILGDACDVTLKFCVFVCVCVCVFLKALEV